VSDRYRVFLHVETLHGKPILLAAEHIVSVAPRLRSADVGLVVTLVTGEQVTVRATFGDFRKLLERA